MEKKNEVYTMKKEKYKNKLDVLLDIFGGADSLLDNYPYNTVGNAIMIRVDNDRRVKVTLYNTFSTDSYDAINFNLMDKNQGKIDSTTILFREVFPEPNDMNHPNKISKHIWFTDCCYSWYGIPTEADIEILKNQLEEYIETWN